MVTMARGKAGDLGPFQAIWRDAYGALSRASRVEKSSDTPSLKMTSRFEPSCDLQFSVVPGALITGKPAPDGHERVWRYLSTDARPNYQAIRAL
jgi:hypothetical protein